jgi:hypothetical protein
MAGCLPLHMSGSAAEDDETETLVGRTRMGLSMMEQNRERLTCHPGSLFEQAEADTGGRHDVVDDASRVHVWRRFQPQHSPGSGIESPEAIALFFAADKAARDGDLEALSSLPKDDLTAVHVPDANKFTALHHVSYRGSARVAEVLIRDFGAEVNLPGGVTTEEDAGTTEEQLTPLHLAALEGHNTCCSTLIKYGASVEAECRQYRATPLHLAAAFGHVYACSTLLLEADPGQATLIGSSRAQALLRSPVRETGYTPLHIACSEGHVDVLRVLMGSFGAKTVLEQKATESKGYTPLLAAAANGRALVCATLLEEYGANVDAVGSDGTSAVDICDANFESRFFNNGGLTKSVLEEMGGKDSQKRRQERLLHKTESGEDYVGEHPIEGAFGSSAPSPSPQTREVAQRRSTNQILEGAI